MNLILLFFLMLFKHNFDKLILISQIYCQILPEIILKLKNYQNFIWIAILPGMN